MGFGWHCARPLRGCAWITLCDQLHYARIQVDHVVECDEGDACDIVQTGLHVFQPHLDVAQFSLLIGFIMIWYETVMSHKWVHCDVY